MGNMSPARVLEWGIREGFRDYLDALPDTRITLDGVERAPSGFRFPARDTAGSFDGRLHAQAHAGALDVILAAPALVETAEGPALVGDTGTHRVTLARLLDVDDLQRLLREGGEARDVALSIDGSTWLGGVYGPWARMDPVRILHPHHGDSSPSTQN